MIFDAVFKRNFFVTLGAIAGLELLSFLGYLSGAVNATVFFLLVAVFLLLCIYRFHYALLIALAELIIGSKGYLFHLDFNGPQLSIRLVFWVLLMLFWFVGFLRHFSKQRRLILENVQRFKFLRAYIFLAVFIVLGVVMALINHNFFKNWFFDLNAWLYFLIIFPWLDFFLNREGKKYWSLIAAVSLGALSWLVFKSLLMLFVFTHFPFESVYSLYRWIRTTGVGEVTLMPNGFYRVFFQSQVYLVFAWFFSFFTFLWALKNHDKTIRLFSAFALILSATVIILSFSRSFWAGIFIATLLTLIFTFFDKNKKQWLLAWSATFVFSIFAVLLVLGIAKFPYPKPSNDFSASSLAQRAEINTDEAALASRWALLPKLWQKIAQEPILGSGFGATVTYQAKDPRILEANVLGTYTTYAFEWGWLDLWLKLGLFGVLTYIYLLVIIIKENLKIKSVVGNSFAMAMVALIALNIFTPYLNHPLGIMFVIFASLYPVFLKIK